MKVLRFIVRALTWMAEVRVPHGHLTRSSLISLLGTLRGSGDCLCARVGNI